MFEQYSQRAMHVVFMARLKACQDGAATLDVAHLLASLLIEDQNGRLGKEVVGFPINGHCVTTAAGPGSKVINPFFLSTTARKLLQQLEKRFCRRDPIPGQVDLPLSLAVRNILQAARWLTERYEQKEVTPLHVLAAALLRDGSAAVLFRGAGVTPHDVLEVIQSQTY